MEINFVLSRIDSTAHRLLNLLPPCIPFASIAHDIENNLVALYIIKEEETIIGATVVRVDLTYTGDRELVVLHVIHDPDAEHSTDFWDATAAGEMEIAKRWDCKKIRRHAERKAHEKLFEKYGYHPVEVIYKREVV